MENSMHYYYGNNFLHLEEKEQYIKGMEKKKYNKIK